jgi:hypothetical protein
MGQWYMSHGLLLLKQGAHSTVRLCVCTVKLCRLCHHSIKEACMLVTSTQLASSWLLLRCHLSPMLLGVAATPPVRPVEVLMPKPSRERPGPGLAVFLGCCTNVGSRNWLNTMSAFS